MKKSKVQSLSSEETFSLGVEIGEVLNPGDILCLRGDLGAGKTTLIKGIASAKKYDYSKVCSPTFSYLHLYGPLAHFDLYRITSLEEFRHKGFEEYLEPPYIALVEWPDVIFDILPSSAKWIEIKHMGDDKREIKIPL